MLARIDWKMGQVNRARRRRGGGCEGVRVVDVRGVGVGCKGDGVVGVRV